MSKHSSFSSYAHIPYSFVHRIGAPETATSFELERLIPEGSEVTQETEAQPVGPEDPKTNSSALVTSPLRS